MSPWKIVLFVAALAGLLWFLAPQRAIAPNEPGAVEIQFMGDAGSANRAAMDEAFPAFKAESRAVHEKNPRHPIYRVIAGQSASRDQPADPTRSLVSVAGGEPPDLMLFDRYAVSE